MFIGFGINLFQFGFTRLPFATDVCITVCFFASRFLLDVCAVFSAWFYSERVHYGFSAPPHQILRDILADFERVTFYGFLLHLAQSEGINKHLGKSIRRSLEIASIHRLEIASIHNLEMDPSET